MYLYIIQENMKKILFIISTFIWLLLFSDTAAADSPLTSTPFYNAYEDVPIVKQAGDKGVIDQEIAAYLKDETNPIDIKAAVINALSWDINGKNNAQLYCELEYDVTLEELDITSLSPDQQFCFGYLMAMDDYFNTALPLEYLKLAKDNKSDSFTVAVVGALIESMELAENEWEDHIVPLLSDSSLKMDMRQDAVNIILDYMALYSNEPALEVSQNKVIVEKNGSQTIYLYGTYSIWGEVPYRIVKSSKIAEAEIEQDQYGIYCLNITGIVSGSSSIEIKNPEDKRVTISLEVIPGALKEASDIPVTGVWPVGVIYGFGALLMAAMLKVVGAVSMKRKVNINQ